MIPKSNTYYLCQNDPKESPFLWKCGDPYEYRTDVYIGQCFCGCPQKESVLPEDVILREATPEEIMRKVL